MRSVFASLVVGGYAISGAAAAAIDARMLGARAPNGTGETGDAAIKFLAQRLGSISPYAAVPSEIDPAIPEGCEVNMASLLSRHGTRFPKHAQEETFAAALQKFKEYGQQHQLPAKYDFLKDMTFKTHSGDTQELTPYGLAEMKTAGKEFYARYKDLAKENAPFIRYDRPQWVRQSMKQWSEGFHEAAEQGGSTADYPYDQIPIKKGPGKARTGEGNPLQLGQCPAFERKDGLRRLSAEAQSTWKSTYAPKIVQRFKREMPQLDLTPEDVNALMEMCPLDSLAHSADVKLSPVCKLFSDDEFKDIDYFYTLEEFYGPGAGNPLGPVQGGGWLSELFARLTQEPVKAGRSMANAKLDSDPKTFPLDRKLYADFSHEHAMSAVLAAMGIYGITDADVPKDSRPSPQQLKMYSAANTVPFGARVYVEKMKCQGKPAQQVRVLVNERVVPIAGCDGDKYGRCPLPKFIKTRKLGELKSNWPKCFDKETGGLKKGPGKKGGKKNKQTPEEA